MGRKALVNAAAVVVVGLGTVTANADVTLTLEPSKDNSLYQDSLGSVSNGAGDYLFVGKTNRGQLRRGAIAFDVSSIPANATISSVMLTLTLSNAGPTVPADVMLHRFTADWGEGASDAGEPGGTGAPAAPGDATWMHAFHSTVPWATPGGSFSPMMSATRSIGGDTSVAYDFTSPQLVADVQDWLANPSANFGWALLGDESRNGTARRFNSREFSQATSRPQLTVVYDVVAAAASTWNIDGGGAWETASNWDGGVPNAVGAEAKFLGKLSAANAPAVVALGLDTTVGKLTFDNANTYAISSTNRHRLTLDNGTSTGEVNVRGGTHEIRTQLRVSGSTEANVESRLNVTGGMAVDAGKSFKKRGPGTLDVSGTAGLGVALGAGSQLEVAEGVLSAGNVRGGRLKIGSAARVNVEPNGTSEGASALDELEIDGQGTLDLADNDLVVRATSATRQSVLDEVVAKIKTARDAAAGRWKGPGVTSSAAEADALTGLVAMTNPGLATFSGEGVGPDDVLVKYTWNGDANLDGRVNADDYFRIDSGFLDQPADPLYTNGDFNYDDRINADDYFLIDSAFLGQTGTLGVNALGAVAAVPEPGAAYILMLGTGLLVRRRRRHS